MCKLSTNLKRELCSLRYIAVTHFQVCCCFLFCFLFCLFVCLFFSFLLIDQKFASFFCLLFLLVYLFFAYQTIHFFWINNSRYFTHAFIVLQAKYTFMVICAIHIDKQLMSDNQNGGHSVAHYIILLPILIFLKYTYSYLTQSYILFSKFVFQSYKHTMHLPA